MMARWVWKPLVGLGGNEGLGWELVQRMDPHLAKEPVTLLDVTRRLFDFETTVAEAWFVPGRGPGRWRIYVIGDPPSFPVFESLNAAAREVERRLGLAAR